MLRAHGHTNREPDGLANPDCIRHAGRDPDLDADRYSDPVAYRGASPDPDADRHSDADPIADTD